MAAQFSRSQVIEILRQDLPTLFEREISYDIYTPEITFTDPLSTFRGKCSYRLIFWALRFHGRLFFTQIAFEVHDILEERDRTLRVNWTVRGTLRLPWRPKLLFDGDSQYHLNADGLIEAHRDTWDRPPIEILKQFFSTSPAPASPP